MEIIGTLKEVYDTQVISDRFQKRELVITTEANTQYPQHVQFQVTQDKCSMLDNLQVGDEVKAQFNLRGREWNGPQGVKYFNTLEAWRIELLSKGTGETTNAAPTNTSPAATNTADDNDDMPF